MKKLVKLYVSGMPINLSDSIKAFGFHGPLELDTKDIFRCLAKGAIVREILNNGKELPLTLSNYNKDNNPVVVSSVKKEEPSYIASDIPQEISVPAESAPVVEEVVEYKEEIEMPSNSVFISGHTDQPSEKANDYNTEVEEKKEEISKQEPVIEDTKPQYQPHKQYQNNYNKGKNKHGNR